MKGGRERVASDRQTLCVYNICVGLCKRAEKQSIRIIVNIVISTSLGKEWDAEIKRRTNWRRFAGKRGINYEL